MCGRYRLSRNGQECAGHFYADYVDLEWQAHYNIAPTQQVPVIRQDAKQPVRHSSLMRWGLVPYWAKDSSVGARMINARSESAATKPAFKDALQRRRCLVPADAFYEWQQTGTKRSKASQPFCMEVGTGEMFAFAGLWDRWRGPDGTNLESFTILTTNANQLLAGVHDRMPVILEPEHYDWWLDPGFFDVHTAKELLKSYPANRMRFFAVSNRVNNVANDDPQCSAPVEVLQAGLF